MKQLSDYHVKVRTTLNNIKGNVYTVNDYKLCEDEAQIVVRALKMYLNTITNNENVEEI